jgi:hypothetical protein
MYTTGTIIEYKGHQGPVKFISEHAITFTISNTPDRMREVNMVIYNHSFNQITLPDSK